MIGGDFSADAIERGRKLVETISDTKVADIDNAGDFRFEVPVDCGDDTDAAAVNTRLNRDLCSLLGELLTLCERDNSPELTLGEKDALVDYFDGLYRNKDFRYRYSDVTGMLTERLKSSPNEEFDQLVPVALVALSTMIVELRDHAGRSRRESAFKALSKLGDHVALEVQRMQYLTSQNERNETRAGELSEDVAKVERRLKKASSSAKSMQKEYIAILGIFSAAVLVANGGFSLAASAAQASVGLQFSQLLSLVALIGLVLFNVLAALFTFIGKIVNQEDGHPWSVMPAEAIVSVNVLLLLFCLLLFRI